VTAVPSWVPLEETKPAPMPLLLVQAFVNTWESDAGSDLLSDPETAGIWLHDAGLWDGDGAPSLEELRFAREVRESLRCLLAQNGGGPPPSAGELRPLQELARTCRLRIDIGSDAAIHLEPDPGDGLDGRLFALLLVIRDAREDGTWQRLKTCDNEDCRWAFYDRSHTQRGRWCDMAVCGNRIKNRNLRERRR
jgi:predicted RNA-binding Zn ribbon-like protein